MKLLKRIGLDGWTVGLESSRFHDFVPGTPCSAFGLALLFYRPARRLGISAWIFKPAVQIGGWSGYVRLWGSP